MVTPALIDSLDRKNLSKNAELSATRFSGDLTSATAEQKKQIADLSGRSRATLYKVKTNGIISACLLVTISFILNVSPYWYTGEAANKEDYSDEIMQKFLIENGYEFALQSESLKEDKTKRVYRRREKKLSPQEEVQPQAIDEKKLEEKVKTPLDGIFNEKFSLDVEAIENLSFENAVKLLEALYIKASANKDAGTILYSIKALLLRC